MHLWFETTIGHQGMPVEVEAIVDNNVAEITSVKGLGGSYNFVEGLELVTLKALEVEALDEEKKQAADWATELAISRYETDRAWAQMEAA